MTPDDDTLDRHSIERLTGLIAETMQRCVTFERVVATLLSSGLPADSADKALAASYDTLKAFKAHLAVVEERVRVRQRRTW